MNRRWSIGALAALAGLAIPAPPGSGAPPRDPGAIERAARGEEPDLPALDETVAELLAAEFLTPDERRALRLKHAVFEPEDLADPAFRVRAALVSGAWDIDPGESGSPEDRAEIFTLRGEHARASALLDGLPGARAAALRLEIAMMAARADDARREAQTLLDTLRDRTRADASSSVWAVRGLTLATRLFPGQEATERDADFRALASVLFDARERLDKLDPEVPLAEARLLWDKDNPADAGKAVESALALRPASAELFALLGEMAVAQFAFDRARSACGTLEVLARRIEPASIAPAAELVRARLRLRQGDPEDALKCVDRVLAALPAQPEALALRAAAHAARFDPTGVESALAAFDAIYPGSARGLMEVGRVLSELRQYEDSGVFLRRAAEREPGWAEPSVELGLMLLQAGDDAEARAALERGTRLDPFNVRADNSLALLRELAGYATIETEHFIVRYRPGLDEILAREMARVLDPIHARVAGDAPGGMDHTPARKTLIELMPDHHWFSVRITGMPRVHTLAASTGPVVAMQAPREGPGPISGPYDWPRVVQHEYAHTVSLSRAKNRLPHWFTEALAVYLEDGPRDYPTVQLLTRVLETDQLFDFDQINIAFVRPERPTDRQQAYAQGHWMYEFLIESFGPRAPLDLLDRYARGQREEEAYREVLGVSRSEFIERFKSWAGTQVVAWGMRPPAGTPTLADLLAARPEPDAEPTREQTAQWLSAHPDHPEVLELDVRLALRDAGGKASADMVPLLRRYAAARPVDPLPHKLLAAYFLGEGASPRDAIEHLEWLDAREQYSPEFAGELARRYAALGDWTKAAAKAARARRIAPFDADERELSARIAIKAGDLALAEEQILAMMAIEPDVERHKQRLEALRARLTPR